MKTAALIALIFLSGCASVPERTTFHREPSAAAAWKKTAAWVRDNPAARTWSTADSPRRMTVVSAPWALTTLRSISVSNPNTTLSGDDAACFSSA